VAAALNVVEPFMSGLGGGGWMHVYHAKSGEHKVLDYCGQCPAGADLASGRFDEETKGLGILAPVIPGSPVAPPVD
jgi:gamma-glutamyltranspeptidase/glutathione hydrolase